MPNVQASDSTGDQSPAQQYGLTLDNVSYRYTGGNGVGPVTLRAMPGRILGIAGSNGTGKTTLLRLVCGLLAPQTGVVKTYGEHVSPGRPPIGLGAMIEEPAFYLFASARQNLEVAAAGRRAWTERIASCLSLVKLSDTSQPVREYSQGMRQRLGLARALLGEPRLLVLDEPLNGLDPAAARWTRELLQEVRARGTTVLVTSHLLGELGRTVDEAVILDAGEVCAEVSRESLKVDPLAIERAYFEYR